MTAIRNWFSELVQTYWGRLLLLTMVNVVLSVTSWLAVSYPVTPNHVANLALIGVVVAARTRQEFLWACLVCTAASGVLLTAAVLAPLGMWWVTYVVSLVMMLASGLICIAMVRRPRACDLTPPQGVWTVLGDGREIRSEVRLGGSVGGRQHWNAYAVGEPVPLPPNAKVWVRAERYPKAFVVLDAAVVTDHEGNRWLATVDWDGPAPSLA